MLTHFFAKTLRCAAIFHTTPFFKAFNFPNCPVAFSPLHFHQILIKNDTLSPTLLDVLSKQDQMEYIHLREMFSKARGRAGLNRLTKVFRQILATVGAFVMKRDGDDAKLGLVRGIFWIDNQIAVNPLRLSTLISKSNFSINSGFQALRYGIVPVRSSFAFGFRDVLQLSDDTIRHWTLRTPIVGRAEPITNPRIREVSSEANVEIEENTEGGRNDESYLPETVDIVPEDGDWKWPEFE
jgi:hypothetical protein